jgi:hypothetical protein
MTQIQTQDEWVLYRLEQFYSKSENIERVKNILNGNSNLSLRLIDWFVTNYSKKCNISYMTKNNRHIVVYLSYKYHLKAYSKRMFDPFCRWKRIQFHDFETTVGQLNFFEWAITDEILDYIETHHTEIHKDMESRLSEMKEMSKNDGEKKKRHELSHSATKSLTKHNVKISVKFD